MNNKVLNTVQAVILLLCLVLAILGAASYASTVGVPNDDVGALHNLSASLRGMLLLIISGVLLLGDAVWFVIRTAISKKRS